MSDETERTLASPEVTAREAIAAAFAACTGVSVMNDDELRTMALVEGHLAQAARLLDGVWPTGREA